MTHESFLKYLFNGWRIEYFHDYIEFTNPLNKNKYKIQLDPYSPVPFLIQLIEKG